MSVDQFKQLFFGLTPADTGEEVPPHALTFLVVGKGSPNLEHRRLVGIFGFPGLQQVGLDLVDAFLQLFRRAEEGNGVAVALAHLSAVQPPEYRHMLSHHRAG